MERRWRFTALEFVVLWGAMNRDRLPFPLTYRATAETADDHGRDHARASDAVQKVFDESLYGAMALLAESETRLNALGYNGRDAMVRLHASMSGPDAVILQQEPGAAADLGSDVIIASTTRRRLAGIVEAALPAASSGREPQASARRSELDGSSRLLLEGSTIAPGHIRITRLLSRPATGFGEVLVGKSTSQDGRVHDIADAIQWVDIDGDGRYLVERSDTVTVTPASGDTIRATIDKITTTVDAPSRVVRPTERALPRTESSRAEPR